MKEVPIVTVKEGENIKCGYEIYPVFFSYAYSVLRSKMFKEILCSGRTA